MGLSTEIIVALIMGIASPSITVYITHRIKKSQENRERAAAAAQAEPDLQTKLRNELRADLERQRLRVLAIEEANDELVEERDEYLKKLAQWKESFYIIRDEKIRLEREIDRVKGEVKELKAQIALLHQTRGQMDSAFNTVKEENVDGNAD